MGRFSCHRLGCVKYFSLSAMELLDYVMSWATMIHHVDVRRMRLTSDGFVMLNFHMHIGCTVTLTSLPEYSILFLYIDMSTSVRHGSINALPLPDDAFQLIILCWPGFS